MAEHSHIEWTDATWNPVTGCSMVSAGCTNCYAMGLAATRLRHHPSRAGLTRETGGRPVWTGEVRLNKQWLDQPLRWERPRRVFVCAHGDLFHESVPDEWIDRVFAVMAAAPQHQFQVLTKRPERMREYVTEREDREIGRAQGRQLIGPHPVPVLPNVWLGTSVEDQATADARIPHLLATPAAVRFVSAEPLLGPVDLTKLRRYNPRGEPWINALRGLVTRGQYLARSPSECSFATSTQCIPPELPRLDWLIVGGESGPGARPMHPDWARSLRDQCNAAGVPFFFKQWGAWAHTGQHVGKRAAGRALDGRTWDEMPGEAAAGEGNAR